VVKVAASPDSRVRIPDTDTQPNFKGKSMKQEDRAELLRRLDAEAKVAGDAVAEVIGQLTVQGLDPFAILAGAHAQIVVGMAMVWGDELAAQRLESAAGRLRNPPTVEDVALALAAPAGTA